MPHTTICMLAYIHSAPPAKNCKGTGGGCCCGEAQGAEIHCRFGPQNHPRPFWQSAVLLAAFACFRAPIYVCFSLPLSPSLCVCLSLSLGLFLSPLIPLSVSLSLSLSAFRCFSISFCRSVPVLFFLSLDRSHTVSVSLSLSLFLLFIVFAVLFSSSLFIRVVLSFSLSLVSTSVCLVALLSPALVFQGSRAAFATIVSTTLGQPHRILNGKGATPRLL